MPKNYNEITDEIDGGQADELAKLRAESQLARDGMRGLHVDLNAAHAELANLRADNERLRAAFRVNMLRATFPDMTREQVDAEIDRVLREGRELTERKVTP